MIGESSELGELSVASLHVIPVGDRVKDDVLGAPSVRHEDEDRPQPDELAVADFAVLELGLRLRGVGVDVSEDLNVHHASIISQHGSPCNPSKHRVGTNASC